MVSQFDTSRKIFVHEGMIFVVDLSFLPTLKNEFSKAKKKLEAKRRENLKKQRYAEIDMEIDGTSKGNRKKLIDLGDVLDDLHLIDSFEKVKSVFQEKLYVRSDWMGMPCHLCGAVSQSKVWFDGHSEYQAMYGVCPTNLQCLKMNPSICFVVDAQSALQIAWLKEKKALLNPMMTPHHSVPGPKGFQLLTHERDAEKGYITVLLGSINQKAEPCDALMVSMARKLIALGRCDSSRPSKKAKIKPDATWRRQYVGLDALELVTMPYLLPFARWPEDMRTSVETICSRMGENIVRKSNVWRGGFPTPPDTPATPCDYGRQKATQTGVVRGKRARSGQRKPYSSSIFEVREIDLCVDSRISVHSVFYRFMCLILYGETRVKALRDNGNWPNSDVLQLELERLFLPILGTCECTVHDVGDEGDLPQEVVRVTNPNVDCWQSLLRHVDDVCIPAIDLLVSHLKVSSGTFPDMAVALDEDLLNEERILKKNNDEISQLIRKNAREVEACLHDAQSRLLSYMRHCERRMREGGPARNSMVECVFEAGESELQKLLVDIDVDNIRVGFKVKINDNHFINELGQALSILMYQVLNPGYRVLVANFMYHHVGPSEPV